jgi:hypothetical protein
MRRMFSKKPGTAKKKAAPPKPAPPELSEAAREAHAREASRQQTRTINASPSPMWGVHIDDAELDPKLNLDFLEGVHPSKHAAVIADFPHLDPDYARKFLPAEDTNEAPAPTKPKKEESNNDGPGPKRYKLWGFNMGQILRWMGAREWDEPTALRALNELGCFPPPHTLKWSLKSGTMGDRYGTPITLTPAQARALLMAAEE